MQRVDGDLVFSPSDLQKFVDCEHLSRLQVRVVDGEIVAPGRHDGELDLLRRKGLEHEHAWLERLQADGRSTVQIPSVHDWSAAAASTEAAMRSGADLIYQGVFVDGSWRGVADFLVRVPQATAFGPWGYEAWDTKLALRGRPSHVLQLAFYSEQIQRVQGAPPEWTHVVLGTNEQQGYRPIDFAAYFRRLKSRLGKFVDSPLPTHPYPIAHCGLCDFEPSAPTSGAPLTT